MNKAASISFDLEQGQAILSALDQAELDINVAVWAYRPEYEEWRLILASPILDTHGKAAAYGTVPRVLDANAFPAQLQPSFLTFRMDDLFTKAIRRRYARLRFADGMRLGPEPFGDRFVESGFAYRIC